MGNVGRHYYAWRHAAAEAGPSAQANALAAAVSGASSDETRYQALLGVMDAMGIGVYANDGAPIVRGAERGAGDFYLHDIEVRQLAAALGRGDNVGVDDLALSLTDAQIAPAGVSVDPALLRQVLLDGARDAQQTPDELSSLTALIVRQLGLTQAHPYDLFMDVPTDDLRFDALQAFLIEADILLPIIKEAGPVDPSQSQLVAQSQGVLKDVALASDNPCDAQVGVGVKETWSGGKWFLGFVKVIGTGAKVALVGIDAIHGSVLAFSVLVYSLDQELSTHYGHESPGAALNFRVKVEMVDDLPENVVKCGWILGVEFPKKGPIKDVSMLWDESNLENFGTVTCGDTCKKTGPDGVASLVFQPKDEISPGAGMLIEERGQVTGVALYQSKHKNVLGSINQLITPKTGTTRWVVAYHQVPSYRVTMVLDYEAHFGIYFPEGDSLWTNTGDGHITYVVNIPASLVTYPRDLSASTTLGATGSGNYHTDQTHVPLECTGAWNGTWGENHINLQLADEPASPGEVAEWVRVYPSQPPIDLYHGGGGCSTGADPFPVYYGALSSPPMFDLSVRTPQTFEVTNGTLCKAPGSEAFTSCDATANWTITVEWATDAH
jgi:hypothetical protein